MTTTPDRMETVDDAAMAGRLAEARDRILAEVHKVIVGQDEVVEQVLLTLFVGGNSLIVGVPGLAKTLLIQTIAQAMDLDFSRIQFTPDLMPSDITGTDLVQEDPDTGRRELVFTRGPIFGNVILADEINRTPPKTQSALLEAMQEHRVTVQGRTYTLEEPFFVFATQNPIELEGTYPLPEAQLDRFMFNVIIGYSDEADEIAIVQRTTGRPPEPLKPVVTGPELVGFQDLVRRVPVPEAVVRYAVSLVRHSRPGPNGAPDFVNKWVNYGASVRAAQYLVLGAKARAVTHGRVHVNFDDIKALAVPVLRHRILKNFHAESERVEADTLVRQLVDAVPVPRSGM